MSRTQMGFTLVEMIVALALFSVVITISVGALLMLVGSNRQFQDEQNVMTSLSFVLDSMTREIRTGTAYYCVAESNDNNTFDDDSADTNPSKILDAELAGSNAADGQYSEQDCAAGNDTGKRFQGVAFVESGNSITGTARHILYYFDENERKLYRKVSGQVPQPLTSEGLYIEEAEFYVTSAKPFSEPGAESTQPTVTIFIKAKESLTADKAYTIQTTVTQRALDI